MAIVVYNYVHQKNLEVHQMINDPIVEALREKEKKSKHIFLNPGPKMLLKKTGS